jgi:hypothetical protein
LFPSNWTTAHAIQWSTRYEIREISAPGLPIHLHAAARARGGIESDSRDRK